MKVVCTHLYTQINCSRMPLFVVFAIAITINVPIYSAYYQKQPTLGQIFWKNLVKDFTPAPVQRIMDRPRIEKRTTLREMAEAAGVDPYEDMLTRYKHGLELYEKHRRKGTLPTLQSMLIYPPPPPSYLKDLHELQDTVADAYSEEIKSIMESSWLGAKKFLASYRALREGKDTTPEDIARLYRMASRRRETIGKTATDLFNKVFQKAPHEYLTQKAKSARIALFGNYTDPADIPIGMELIESGATRRDIEGYLRMPDQKRAAIRKSFDMDLFELMNEARKHAKKPRKYVETWIGTKTDFTPEYKTYKKQEHAREQYNALLDAIRTIEASEALSRSDIGRQEAGEHQALYRRNLEDLENVARIIAAREAEQGLGAIKQQFEPEYRKAQRAETAARFARMRQELEQREQTSRRDLQQDLQEKYASEIKDLIPMFVKEMAHAKGAEKERVAAEIDQRIAAWDAARIARVREQRERELSQFQSASSIPELEAEIPGSGGESTYLPGTGQ